MKGHDYLLSLGSCALATALVLADGGWQGQLWAQPGEPVPEVVALTSMAAQRFYIKSQDPLVKSRFVVRHQFPTAFSAVLTPQEVTALTARGIAVEPVQIFHIVAKPGTVCGNGTCDPGENKNNCPADCTTSDDDGDTGARSCYPEDATPWGIDRLYGDQPAYLPSGGYNVTVAVLDTGVNINHPDLKNRIKDCKDATKQGGIKNGCVDNHGHGTHVSGTILADGGDDGDGIFGVAPEAGLMAIKVCGNAFCWGDDIAAGINYAAGAGANIISMSLGSNAPDSQVLAAIDKVAAEVLVVAAAGNDGPAEGSIDYPGAYHKVIAVGAINQLGLVPDWSSRGSNNDNCTIEEKEVELGAPGVNVESTYNDGCYTYMSGTSMATPHVSGLAAREWRGDAATTRGILQRLAPGPCPTDKATGFGLPTI